MEKKPKANRFSRGCVVAPQGSTLYENKTNRLVETTYNQFGSGWYFIAGGHGTEFPLMNSGNNTVLETEQEAKKSARAYVRKHLGR